MFNDLAFEAALKKAIEYAIEQVGFENFKKISWFMSNRKNSKELLTNEFRNAI